jgi:hypothetical protein
VRIGLPLHVPITIGALCERGHHRAIGQIGECVAAVQTAHILKENQILAMSTVKRFHRSPVLYLREEVAEATAKLELGN